MLGACQPAGALLALAAHPTHAPATGWHPPSASPATRQHPRSSRIAAAVPWCLVAPHLRCHAWLPPVGVTQHDRLAAARTATRPLPSRRAPAVGVRGSHVAAELHDVGWSCLSDEAATCWRLHRGGQRPCVQSRGFSYARPPAWPAAGGGPRCAGVGSHVAVRRPGILRWGPSSAATACPPFLAFACHAVFDDGRVCGAACEAETAAGFAGVLEQYQARHGAL